MTDNLHQEPERDQFKSESPIRAFTDWTVQGRYALGKGFRPSLAHVVPYLDAMESKEGWQLVQVLESDTQTPSFLFRQCRVVPDDVLLERLLSDDGYKQQVIDHLRGPGQPQPPAEAIGGHWTDQGSDTDIPVERHEDALRFIAAERGMDADRLVKDFMLYFKERNWRTVAHKTFYRQLQFILPAAEALELKQLIDKFRVANQQPPAEAISRDDPINPKHYGGTACAEIGELLSANSYQVLKYNWRLGGKDDPCIEIGKSLWYLEREIALANAHPGMLPYDGYSLPDHAFFERRLSGQSEHTIAVARALISWNRYGRLEVLKSLQKLLQDKRDWFTCADVGRGLAI